MSGDRPPHTTPAANDEAAQLASLKRLLIGTEQDDLAALRRALDDPAEQRQRVSAQLPDALEAAYEASPRRLTDALDEPVEACIRESVHRDPAFFGDILYPVMGPAIRRAIRQAIRGLVQQINQGVEHSLTLKGLRWRLEAARTGLPFSEIVLRNTLRFRVEDAFLIQGGSGLLIAHRGRTGEDDDHDAMSAMLTAIRDFARDTFDQVDWREARLEAIDAGEHTLWLAHGPRAYLACAVRGVAPEALRDHFNTVIERLHAQHGRLLEYFDGDPATAAPVKPLLDSCLQSETPNDEPTLPRWPAAVVGLALLAGASWLGWSWWQAHVGEQAMRERQAAAVAALEATPGIVVADSEAAADRLEITLLADPLAADPETVVEASGLAPGDYRIRSHRFESADPAIALARAAQRLQPPSTVTLDLVADGRLSAQGEASPAWRERATLLAMTIPGVTTFDDSALRTDPASLLEALQRALQPPPGVTIALTGDTATIAGVAPSRWLADVESRARTVDGLGEIDTRGLQASERVRLDELQAAIGGFRLPFGDRNTLTTADRARLAGLARLASEARQLAGTLSTRLRLRILGRTDGTGTPQQNRIVATQRARIAADLLRATALPLPTLTLGTRIAPPGTRGPDPELRRVEFELEIGEVSADST